MEDMIVATGEGCFYYTGLSQQNKGSRYDVWLYDCEKKQNRRLLTGEQIENLLPEPPAAGCDYIELQNDPSSNHYFDNFAMSDNYMENCFVFNTKPFGKNDDKYGFSCYKRGENKVIRIEKNFYTQSYICDDRRKQIIYEREDFTKENSESEFFSYASGGKKKRLFTSGDLGKILRENGVMPEEYFFYPDWAINGSRLYLVSSTVVSYDLEDKKIRFEKELTEQMKEEKTELVSFCGIAEGRFFIRKVKLDEEEEEIDETERIYGYDLAKKSGKMLSENNPEYLYYLLV